MSGSLSKNSSQRWPAMKYGLGIAFDHAQIAWPDALPAVGVGPAVHAPVGVTVLRDGASGIEASDRLAVLHRGHARPVVIDVPAGLRCAQPIVLDTTFAPGFLAEEVTLHVGRGASVTVVEHGLAGQDDAVSFRSARVRLFAAAGAKVNYVRLQDAQPLAIEWHESVLEIEESAEVTWLDAVFGGNFVHADVTAALKGKSAAFRHRALLFGRAGQRFDVAATARHEADRTVSDLATRGALAAGAKAIVRGRVAVKNGTIGCVGRQELRGFILAPGAEFDALPQLETGTEDVRASHAATVGRLDREKLFYLMSRGLDRPAAVRTLTEAFFAPLIAVMRGSGLEEAATCIIVERLNALAAKL